MDNRDYLVVAAAFFISAAIGFAGHQVLDRGDEFVKKMDVRADHDNQEATARFDSQNLTLVYENFKQAKFYFEFNDSREEQLLKGLRYNGKLQTTKKIRSFGNKTYILYLRYRDNASKFDDGWIELYRIEEA